MKYRLFDPKDQNETNSVKKKEIVIQDKRGRIIFLHFGHSCFVRWKIIFFPTKSSDSRSKPQFGQKYVFINLTLKICHACLGVGKIS